MIKLYGGETIMKINTAKITRIALSVAFISIGAQLTIPATPAVTLQTLCIFITAVILKPHEAFISSFIYLLLGAVGVPVFSAFGGGLGAILGVGGGFLISFPFVALAVSAMSKKFVGSAFTHAFSFTIGTLICYLFGALWIEILGYYNGAFGKMLTLYVLPFIPFDAVKIALATLCAIKLGKIFKNEKKKNTTDKAK